jgi:endoglucanase
VRLTNTGTAAIPDWTATWTMPPGVLLGSGWNATVTQQGQTITAKAPSWSPNLAAAATVSIGFTATGPATPAASGFHVGTTSCT